MDWKTDFQNKGDFDRLKREWFLKQFLSILYVKMIKVNFQLYNTIVDYLKTYECILPLKIHPWHSYPSHKHL